MTHRPAHIPADYYGIHCTGDMGEVVRPFARGKNCNLLSRGELGHDFNALARQLKGGVLHRDDYNDYSLLGLQWRALRLRGTMKAAAEFIIEQDMKPLDARFDTVLLRVIKGEKGLSEPRQFHAHDVNSVVAAYAGNGTEFLRNDQGPVAWAQERGKDNSFLRYSHAHDADIHSMRAGDIWYQAGFQTEGTAPFIHKAPAPPASGGARMLLLGWNSKGGI